MVPTLLTWPGSAIVHEIKGENWNLTSGYRARFGRVLRFDPTSANSDAYNPMLEVELELTRFGGHLESKFWRCSDGTISTAIPA